MFWDIVGIIFAIGVLILSIYMLINGPRMERELNESRELHEDERTKKFNNEIMKLDFRIDKYIEVMKVETLSEKSKDKNNFKIRFAFDNVNKYFFIMNYDSLEVIKYKYSDLIEFELNEDNQSIVQGRVGSAVVGAVAFGATGAVIGSSRSRKIKENVNNIEFVIRLSDFNMPSYKIVFSRIKLSTTDPVYLKLMTEVNMVIDSFIYIKNFNEGNILK